MKIYYKYNVFNKKYYGLNFYVYKYMEMIRYNKIY